ncbi:MAG: hypothetical protein M0P69_00145 [Bacteroidales bacterium]|nr:hypothetical protein [Bacteroidales bacterium]
MKRFSLLLLLTVILFACDKTEVPEVDGPSLLVGIWSIASVQPVFSEDTDLSSASVDPMDLNGTLIFRENATGFWLGGIDFINCEQDDFTWMLNDSLDEIYFISMDQLSKGVVRVMEKDSIVFDYWHWCNRVGIQDVLYFRITAVRHGVSVPVMKTAVVIDITDESAVCGGTLTTDAGSPVTTRGVCWSTHESPTLSDFKTTDGDASGSFVSTITGLAPGTIYYLRAYATNSNGTGYGNTRTFTTHESGYRGSITDPRDGTPYQTVRIGDREWMAENLRYLPEVTEPGTGSSTEPCYYVYGYEGTDVVAAKSHENYATYGVLYNWPAAMDVAGTGNPGGVQGICPPGWHLPDDAEWEELITLLGGGSVAGGKLKESGTTHWSDPNAGATNESGFTARPAGIRGYGAGRGFSRIGTNAVWWSATESMDSEAWGRNMGYAHSGVARIDYAKDLGLSVRCLRDE